MAGAGVQGRGCGAMRGAHAGLNIVLEAVQHVYQLFPVAGRHESANFVGEASSGVKVGAQVAAACCCCLHVSQNSFSGLELPELLQHLKIRQTA